MHYPAVQNTSRLTAPNVCELEEGSDSDGCERIHTELGPDTMPIHVFPVHYDREDFDENSAGHGKIRSNNCSFMAVSRGG